MTLAATAAATVARYLDEIGTRTTVSLYGCGDVAETLVTQHAGALDQHDVTFVTSESRPGASFHGHAVAGVSDLAAIAPERVIILSDTHQVEMLRNARTRVPRDRILTLRDLESRFLRDDIAAINHLVADGPPVVCFTTISSFHHFLKLMLTLRKQGYRVLLVLNNTGISNTLDMTSFRDRGYFDYLYVSKYSYADELIQILRSCRIAFVHAVASMAEHGELATIVSQSPCPVFVEYADFKQLVFEDNDALAMSQLELSAAALEAEKQAQRTVYTRSCGVIIKDSPEIIDHLQRAYGHRPQWLHHFPWPCAEMLAPIDPTSKLSRKTGGIHLVFAGCLHNNPRWHPTGHHHSTVRAIRMLADQGIYFTIYNGMDSDGKGYEEYLELARSSAYFQYHFAVPYDRLPALLSVHDFGWFCFDYSSAPESPFFHKTTFGSKIFSYIEAGLPILISPDVEYMCRVVTELGVGMPLAFADIPRLSETLRRTNLEPLMNSVRRVRDEMSIDRQIANVVDFYSTAASGAAEARDGRQ